MRVLAAATVLLVLALPAAAGFAATRAPLVVVFAEDATPVVVASGALALAGEAEGGLLLGGAGGTALRGIPDLVVVHRGRDLAPVAGATVELHSGGLVWLSSAGLLALDVRAPYGIGLALPRTPLPSSGGIPPGGFLLAGEALAGSATWSGAPIEVVPLEAVITLRDAAGEPIPDWDARRVNAGAGPSDDPDRLEVVLRVEGPFQVDLRAAILGGRTGGEATLGLRARPAEVDRFAPTVALLGATTGAWSGANLAAGDSPLVVLEKASGLLNGALVIVPGDGTTAPADPLSSRWGEEPFPLGSLSLARGDVGLAWGGGELRVEGEPDVALGREGFAMAEPARVGAFPIVSVVLWLAAIAAIVLYFVRRPPQGSPDRGTRLVAAGVHAAVLAAALLLWDRSFEQTFGTGVAATIEAEGLSAAVLPRLGVLAAFELVPWSVAALLFALPVRIAAGVGLRYLGRGKSYKGLASAAGLAALATLGPLYALWCFNLVWRRAGDFVG